MDLRRYKTFLDIIKREEKKNSDRQKNLESLREGIKSFDKEQADKLNIVNKALGEDNINFDAIEKKLIKNTLTALLDEALSLREAIQNKKDK